MFYSKIIVRLCVNRAYGVGTSQWFSGVTRPALWYQACWCWW